ncbi:MAG TPA: hypothetical protein VL137_02890 [Polyangiaceae bacterium]|nr:hypothetical protein [Polyangiaceae bacterium]
MSPIRLLFLALAPVVVLVLLTANAWAQKPAHRNKGHVAVPHASPVAAAPEPAAAPAPAAPAAVSTPGAGEVTLEASHKAGSVKGDVKVEENKEGVKTYTFGAQELEGRLKSPQILYFLRRVRAQFDPSGLGHRSFLRELADTRRNPAVR